MAVGSGPPRLPGALVALLMAGLCLGTLIPLLLRTGEGGLVGADWAALRFTLVQAALSAGLSVGLGVPVARALARRRFPGRSALVTLLGAPFVLPVIVAVLGLLALFGRSGLVNEALGLIGGPRMSVYGLHGVVLAHVFLNLPLATRLILQGWLDIPAERFRLAATLGAPIWPLLEWPMLRRILPGAFAAIFALCLTSFSVALILGGGPRATTVELAIYQAIRFEADFAGAAQLALLQYAICGVAAGFALWLSPPALGGGGLGRSVERWDAAGAGARVMDAAWIGGAALFLLLPLGLAVLRGVGGLSDLPVETMGAALRSVMVAVSASVLTVGAALALALRAGTLAQLAGALPLAASSLVLGTGLLLVLRSVVGLSAVALPVTALVDAVASLPFALRALAPAVAEIEARHGRLADSLGLVGARRLRVVILPLARPALGFAGGLAAALSMGNLGVIALFAGPGQETLPLLMAQLMGAYRMEAAAATGLLILALALLLFWIFDRGGRIDASS
ncbi:thiamine/thiamine pyrophosphate ABC transporter permease ThiP [Rubellimicrobium arenae]|uniref:thiamine/thiamine pyrophosphate ABC transporter permease ThiP n=1 Tax=Rubellimicrobium arenae TaxID=2817372 RepID=UPI001B313AE7|nr:thiamine/thiamine pyrophosphate ABC transporter permease ThiP [Rubellimicrobium arenae]